MRTITFNVDQQRIKNKDNIGSIYGGTDNYLKFTFEFSNDWDGCYKAITFDNKNMAFLLDQDNSYVVPKEAFDETKLVFHLVGKKSNYRIQTKSFTIRLGGY